MANTEQEEQAIVEKFRELIEERRSIAEAVIDRQHDIDEHDLVLRNMEKQDASKRAWMLVGDVLVERTVGEMIPEVVKKRDNLVTVNKNLQSQYESKQKEVLAFQEKYNIRIKDENKDKKATSGGTAQGVLVSSS